MLIDTKYTKLYAYCYEDCQRMTPHTNELRTYEDKQNCVRKTCEVCKNARTVITTNDG
jgi:hypothetical protein